MAQTWISGVEVRDFEELECSDAGKRYEGVKRAGDGCMSVVRKGARDALGRWSALKRRRWGRGVKAGKV